MSGHRVVSILDSFKEGYVYGGAVHRRKQSVLSGAKAQQPGSPTEPPKVIDLVLSHKGAFKLKSKAVPPQSAKNAEAGKDPKKKQKFSRRGGDSDQPSSNIANNDEDEEEDLLDADAMMRAAADGEDIQR
eukprot:PhF_6_TR28862/c0_g1_i1/m.42211